MRVAQRHSALSGVFEKLKNLVDHTSLQQAVDRIVRIIQNDPDEERIDKILTRWLKRHLQRLNADIDLEQLHSLLRKNKCQKTSKTGAKKSARKGVRKDAQKKVSKSHCVRTH